jgi:hypothetical protein
VNRRPHRHPELVRLLARVDLEHHRHLLADFAGVLLDLLRQTQAVDTVDVIDQRQQRLDLVALEVPQHVPPQLRRHRRRVSVGALPRQELVHLRHPLRDHLHPALPQIRDAQLHDFADLLRRRRLGHPDQDHLLGLAVGLRGRLRDPIPDLIQLFRERRFLGHNGSFRDCVHKRPPRRII